MPWVSPSTRASLYSVLAANWNEFVNNFLFLNEVAYTQFTSNVSITATTDATAQTVVSSGAITYENVPHLITFQAYEGRPDSGAVGRQLVFNLYDSTTDLGRLGLITTPAASNMDVPVHLERRITPTAASHTYQIKAWVSAGTGTVGAGAGGAGVALPGFIRVVRLPT